jgi:hypothetical protein
MASELFVDNITGKTGTSGSAPLTLSGNAATLGSGVTFPDKIRDRTIFYQTTKASTQVSVYGLYPASQDIQNSAAYAVGVAPKGFASVVEMYWWWIPAQSGTNNYTHTFSWNIAASGQAIDNHSLSATAVVSSLSKAQNNLQRTDLMSTGSSGSRFEDVIAADDIFGLEMANSLSLAIRSIGIAITWRF